MRLVRHVHVTLAGHKPLSSQNGVFAASPVSSCRWLRGTRGGCPPAGNYGIPRAPSPGAKVCRVPLRPRAPTRAGRRQAPGGVGTRTVVSLCCKRTRASGVGTPFGTLDAAPAMTGRGREGLGGQIGVRRRESGPGSRSEPKGGHGSLPISGSGRGTGRGPCICRERRRRRRGGRARRGSGVRPSARVRAGGVQFCRWSGT